MLAERKRIDLQILAIQEELQSLPAGKLLLSHNEQNYKWYQSDGSKKSYIPKKNRPLAVLLARKQFLTFHLEELINEKTAIDSYLKLHHPYPTKEFQLISDNSEFANLLSSYYKPLSQELSEWENASYPRNPKFPEQLRIKTISGNLVRSKSEAIIDMSLHVYQIPFRYECELTLGSSVFFPDFTLRHPRTGKTYYWEHFGKMDDPHYANIAYSKLQTYTSHGIFPMDQLITTYETKANPLSSEMVEKIIAHYFS